MGDGSRDNQVGGEVFGAKYESLGELGSGGFGKVYRARQLTTGQDVAVKVIPVIFKGAGTAADDRHLARLEREMTLSARLQHPNIVRLLDSGRSDDGRIFAVFAFIPGETIGQVLKCEGPLALDETIYLMGQVLDALAAAHKQGVVHRDLKPSNIMLTTTGVRRNAMVLDFGIGASIRELHDERLAKLTGTGEMVGTLVTEARSSAHPSLFLECRCAEESKGSPLRPIAELLEQLIGLSPEMTEEAKISRVRSFRRSADPDVAHHRAGVVGHTIKCLDTYDLRLVKNKSSDKAFGIALPDDASIRCDIRDEASGEI